jgi:glycine C-acetyltransferase
MNSNLLLNLEQELNSLREQKLFRALTVLESSQGPRVTIGGKKVVNLASNNYLGLTTHPRLIEAALRATEKWGVGSGAVRTIAGTMSVHQQLEEKLAAFKEVEAVLVFQSGFTCNMGVIQPLLTDKDVIISDALNHASIIDGIRLSKAERRIFPHKDMDALEDILQSCGKYRIKLVVTDGVFSMDGDIAPLKDIVELAEKYDAVVMVDDAHASGVLGRNGRGSVDYFGLHGRVDIQVGTLSKAIGVLGGYIAGSQKLKDFLIHRGRPFLFSSSHPPGVAAANMAAIDVLLEEPELIAKLWENTRYFKENLTKMGFNTGESETPITPVIVGQGDLAMSLSDELLKEGVFAPGIGYPTVPQEKSRVRTIVTATHTKEDLDLALEAFEKAGSKLGIC